MRVQCKFYGPLSEAVGDKMLPYEVPGEATVESVLSSLAEEHPELEEQLFADGALRESLIVMVNQDPIDRHDGTDTELTEDDTLAISPSVSGGRTPLR